MPKPDLTPVNLGSIARGAALELFEKCMADVAKNIADTDTDEEAARTISLTFKIKPESDRRTLHITTSAKTTLAGARDHARLLFLEDPRQDVLFEAPKATNNILDFKAGEQA